MGEAMTHREQVTVLRTTYAERAELLMQEVRTRLGQAVLCAARGEPEIAEAYVAVAANKIAVVLRISPPVIAP